MSKSRIPTWVSLVLLGVGLLVVGIPGLLVYMSITATKVHPDSQNIPSLTNSPPLPKWAGAVEQARQIVRASHVREQPGRDSLLPSVSMARSCGRRALGLRTIENSLPVTPNHRFRTGTASIVFTSAAIGLLLDEGRLKLDDEIQALRSGVSGEAVACDRPPGDGACGGVKTEDPDDGVLTSSHCERPADAVALFAKEPLLFQPGTEYRDSTFGWVLLSAVVEAAADTAVCGVSQRQNISSARHAGHFQGIGDEPTAGRGDFVQSEIRCESLCTASSHCPNSIIPATRDPTGSCPHRRTWCVSGWRSTVASCCVRRRVQTLQTPQRLASGRADGLRARLGSQDRNAGGSTGSGGWSQRPFLGWRGGVSCSRSRNAGLAVAVMSNISFAGTPSLAEKIAQAFAEQGRSPARK